MRASTTRACSSASGRSSHAAQAATQPGSGRSSEGDRARLCMREDGVDVGDEHIGRPVARPPASGELGVEAGALLGGGDLHARPRAAAGVEVLDDGQATAGVAEREGRVRAPARERRRVAQQPAVDPQLSAAGQARAASSSTSSIAARAG